MTLRSVQLVTALALLGGAGAASAQEAGKGIVRTLVDRSLNERTVVITGLEPGAVTYMEGGLLRNESREEYLAILPAPPPPPPAPSTQDRLRVGPPPEPARESARTRLVLIDGQVLAGAPAPDGAAPAAPDVLAWSHPLLGTIQLKLDDVQRLVIRSMPGDANIGELSGDLIILENGDRLEGFVESVGDPLRITLGEQVREIPLDRIAAVHFANPAAERSGMYIWLSDSSVVAVREIRTTRIGELHVVPRLASDSESTEMAPGAAASMALSELIAANLDAAALAPLSSLSPESQAPLAGRRWAPPIQLGDVQALGASDIVIPGPMRVEWALPSHLTRLSTTAELPRENWGWGDCELVLLVRTGDGAEREVQRHRLNIESPSARLNVPIGTGDGRRLILRLEPGRFGAVQDGIVLRRPLLAASGDDQ